MRLEGQAALQDAYPTKVETRLSNPDTASKDKTVELKMPEEKQKPKIEEVQDAVAFANKAMKMANYHLEFEIHEDINRYQVKVINSESGDTIREIPSDAMIKFAEGIKNTINSAVGLLVDESV
ncbi:MAG: flagellar protein FlaG [Syntrophomonadaceae bacterium]